MESPIPAGRITGGIGASLRARAGLFLWGVFVCALFAFVITTPEYARSIWAVISGIIAFATVSLIVFSFFDGVWFDSQQLTHTGLLGNKTILFSSVKAMRISEVRGAGLGFTLFGVDDRRLAWIPFSAFRIDDFYILIRSIVNANPTVIFDQQVMKFASGEKVRASL